MIKFFVLIMMSLSCLSQAEEKFSQSFIDMAKKIISENDQNLNVDEIRSYQCSSGLGDLVCVLGYSITNEVPLQVLFVPVLGDEARKLDELNNIY